MKKVLLKKKKMINELNDGMVETEQVGVVEPDSAKDFFNGLIELDKKLDYVHWEVKRSTTLLVGFMCVLFVVCVLAYFLRNFLF